MIFRCSYFQKIDRVGGWAPLKSQLGGSIPSQPALPLLHHWIRVKAKIARYKARNHLIWHHCLQQCSIPKKADKNYRSPASAPLFFKALKSSVDVSITEYVVAVAFCAATLCPP